MKREAKPSSGDLDRIAETIFRKLSDLTSKLHGGQGLNRRDHEALCAALREYAASTARRRTIPKPHAHTLTMIQALLIPFSFSYSGEEARIIFEATEELEELISRCLS